MPASLRANEPALRELMALPLHLRARVVARSLWSGIEATRRRGPGGVFRELREYRPGDPVRRLDWRASARTDRWLIRELERTAHLRVLIVLDRSESMAYAERAAHSKGAIAATLAAAVGVHALHQGHAVALWDAAEWGARPRPGLSAEAEILRRLEMPTTAPRAFPEAWETSLKQVDLVLVLSDWLDETAPATLQALGLVAARHVDVRALQLLHGDELDFPFRGPTEFVPLEGGGEPPLRLEPRQVAAAYEQALHAHLSAVRAAAYGAAITLNEHRTDGDLFAAATYLSTGIAA